MNQFRHIDTWVFDLDNTLYDAEAYIFPEMGKRMTQYVMRHLGVPEDVAARMRNEYYQKYGTTLRGLMTEHGVPADTFLKEVHEGIDIAKVAFCPTTAEGVASLTGRKYIFTNAPRHFAEPLLGHLGVIDHLDGIFTVEDADYWPKPDIRPYHKFLQKFDIDPKTACMFEDMQINLKPAHDLGMTTVWLHGQDTDHRHDHDHVHHAAPRITHWINSTLRKK